MRTMYDKRVKSAVPAEPKTKTPEQALAALMRLCARAEKSSGDALRLMARWGVPEEARRTVLERLVREKFIDDGRYAGAFVREKTRLGGWGAYKIRSALVAKGVDRTVIEAALAEYGDSGTERLGQLLARRRRLSKPGEEPGKTKARLVRYGISLGYDYGTVLEEVEKTMNDEEDDR